MKDIDTKDLKTEKIFNILFMSIIFKDIAQTIGYGLNQLGYSVYFTQAIVKGAYNIIFGAHLISDWEIVPNNSIIFNLEQLGSESHYLTESYINNLRKHAVWDYSQQNLNWLKENSVNAGGKLVKIGYSPDLSRIKPALDQDIDVLFYGAIGDRRLAVLRQLESKGLKVVAIQAYGDDLDSYIARSKVVINLHHHETKVFEIVRVSYLLANSKAVVAEVDHETEIDSDLVNAIQASRYENLADTCYDLIFNDQKRKDLEETGFAVFSVRNQAEYLKNAVSDLLQSELTKREDPVIDIIELINKANRSIAKGEFDLALTCYQQWLLLHSDKSPLAYTIYFNLGVLLHQINDKEGAISSYKKAINAHPNFTPAYTNLAILQDLSN